MTGSGWSDVGFEEIAQLLSVRAGLSFRQSQRASIEDAIRRAMQQADVSNMAAYLQLLNADSETLDNLLIEATVGETYFFRDPGQFKIIRTKILPDICRMRHANQTLRLWSAGCATGEEAYSLAMMLHQQRLLHRSRVLGTDISRDSIKTALQANYRDWSLRGQGTEFSKPYLVKDESGNRVVPEIRDAVHFEYLNLALDNYPSTATGTRGVDLILCRNVMIYFDQETINSVVKRFHHCLSDGGWLVTASSDPLIHELDLFEVVATDSGLYYRKEPAPAKFSPRQSTFQERELPPANANDAVKSYDAKTFNNESLAEVLQEQNDESGALQTSDDSLLSQAKQAIKLRSYEQAAELTKGLLDQAEAAIIHVSALANHDAFIAEQVSVLTTQKHPLSKELHYLHAVLLMDLNRHAEAGDAFRRVLYLDRSLAIAHYSLGIALRTVGKIEGAQRALRSAHKICVEFSPSDQLPLGEGQTVGELLDNIKFQLETLEKSRRQE